jgi:hypothetical protein
VCVSVRVCVCESDMAVGDGPRYTFLKSGTVQPKLLFYRVNFLETFQVHLSSRGTLLI